MFLGVCFEAWAFFNWKGNGSVLVTGFFSVTKEFDGKTEAEMVAV